MTGTKFILLSLLLTASVLLCGQQITFWFAGGDPSLDLPIVREHVRAFEEDTGIRVNLVVVPWAEDPHTKIQVAIMSGRAPDLVKLGTPFEHVLARFGVLEPLDGLVSEEVLAEFTPALIEAARYSPAAPADMTGKIVSVPYFVDTRAILYRKDIFEERGVPEPMGWTWDDFVKYSKMLTFDRTGNGRIDVHGFGTAANYLSQSVIFAWQAGGQLLDGLDYPGFTDPAFVEGMQFYYDLFHEHNVVQPGAVNVQLWDVRRMVAEGRVAMYIDAGDSARELYNVIGDKLGVGLMPAHPETGAYWSYFGADSFVIPSQARNKEAAAKLLEWMVDADRMTDYCRASGFLPSRVDAAADPYFANDPIRSVYLKQMEESKAWIAHPEASFITRVLRIEIQNALERGTHIGEALEKAQKEVEAQLRQRGYIQ